MGLYDRDYTREKDDETPVYTPQIRIGLPCVTPAVKGLIIANIAVFLVNSLFAGPAQGRLTLLEVFFTVYPSSWLHIAQLWRLITYQFVHWDFWHIFFNMLALYFFGPALERHWGSRKFLIFYLSCGVAGGLFYTLLAVVGFLTAGPMAGASGAIFGVLIACAILFPRFIVLFFFFPMPIRVAAVIWIGLSVVTVLAKGANAGGEAAHLAGIAAGAFYVLSESWRVRLKLSFKVTRWQRNLEMELKVHIEVDRILKKVHDSGLQSLTPAEKRTLKKATRLEQERLKL